MPNLLFRTGEVEDEATNSNQSKDIKKGGSIADIDVLVGEPGLELVVGIRGNCRGKNWGWSSTCGSGRGTVGSESRRSKGKGKCKN